MTTSVTVRVPEDASYKAVVVALDAQPNGPSASFRIEVPPGNETVFYAHATRVIEVSEEPIAAVEVDTGAGSTSAVPPKEPEQRDPAPALAGLGFGEALRALMQGALVRRAGWNGKGMWLAMTPGSTIPASSARSGACKALAEWEGAPQVTILPHIDMRGADGRVTCGWAPSQPDMFAEDWQLVAVAGKSIAPPARAVSRPVSSDEAVFEQQLQASGKMAPRLTPELIDAQIVDEWYAVVPNSVLTICALTLRNGFVVVGYDGPVSAENFDAAIGRQSARTNAREQIWRLEGYWLRSALAGVPAPTAATPA